MSFQLASWPPRRLVAIWGGGALLEAVLALPLCVLLARPEPPLVARLRGRDALGAQRVVLRTEFAPVGRSAPEAIVAAPVPEDSFYTVLHWPLNKPLLEGGGRVLAMPMHRWWVPALYIGVVPLVLVGLRARADDCHACHRRTDADDDAAHVVDSAPQR
jgi:hypothetical protein